MGQFSALSTEGQLNKTVGNLLGEMLSKGMVKGVLVPTRQSHQRVVMQTLITDPARLDAIDPFAPVVPINSSKLIASLTATPTGHLVAVVLRSCELRAFLELVKLNQGHMDDLVLIGIDCLGRYENTDYRLAAKDDEDLSLTFLKGALNGNGTKAATGADITKACKACEYPVVDNVDLRLCVIGSDPAEKIWLEAISDKGEQLLSALEMEHTEQAPEGREQAVTQLIEQRLAFKKELFEEIQERAKDMDGLSEVVAGCINCYNCRVACPVCYCRECVFVTDTFRHDSEQYLKWSTNRGQIKMPTDTIFYHLTRMIHMSTLCIGCGQCTSACPNDIPVMELFRSVAERTQGRFDYLPGRSLEEGQPLAIFHAEEYDDVTGQVK